jgi:uridine kinase
MGPPLDIVALRAQLQGDGVTVVGIDGPGGSGKSTLARMLIDGWRGAVVVEMDDFYVPAAELAADPGRDEKWGRWVDRERVIAEVLAPLRAGKNASYRRLDWETDRLIEGRTVSAGSVVLLEGVYSTSAPLRKYVDYTIWVTCPYELRLTRGIERDGEQMRVRWVDQWIPAEERYLRGERPDLGADLHLDGGSTAGMEPVFEVLARRS